MRDKGKIVNRCIGIALYPIQKGTSDLPSSAECDRINLVLFNEPKA